MQNNNERSDRKTKQGIVVSNKMEKTVVVRVERKFRHPQYDKVIVRGEKFFAHDDTDALEVGDEVKIMETRPLSKLKNWRVTEVVKKGRTQEGV